MIACDCWRLKSNNLWLFPAAALLGPRQAGKPTLAQSPGGRVLETEFEPPPGGSPDKDDPRVERAMMERELNMKHQDEHNPKHMAHMMRKMKDLMPAGAMPKELDVAIKRLEAGEAPEKIEADMGDVLGDFMGGPEDEEGGMGGGGGYARDSGLYDY